MRIDKALDIFDIEDLSKESESSIRKKYKKLMIKYHPDNFGSDSKAKEVSVAYEIVRDAFKKTSLLNKSLQHNNDSKSNVTIIIPLQSLCDIYSGKTVHAGKYEVNIKNIRLYNVYISIDVSIVHKGITENINTIVPWDISDEYTINHVIYVDKLINNESIKIVIESITKDIEFSTASLKMRIKLEHNVGVNIIIQKKIKQKEE